MGVLGAVYCYKNKNYLGIDNTIYSIVNESSDLLGNSLEEFSDLKKIKKIKNINNEINEVFGYIKDNKIISRVSVLYSDISGRAVKDIRVYIESLLIFEEFKNEKIELEIIEAITKKYIGKQLTVVLKNSDESYKLFESCGFKKFKTLTEEGFDNGEYDLLFKM